MDLGTIGFVGLVVLVITEVLKEKVPSISGNVTRLVAMVIGGLIGLLSQYGLIDGLNINLVGGVFAGVAAVAGNILASRREEE